MADESGKAGVTHETSTHEDDHSSLSSHDAQLGVKHIEAISQTWTRWSLISAYVGYVGLVFTNICACVNRVHESDIGVPRYIMLQLFGIKRQYVCMLI